MRNIPVMMEVEFTVPAFLQLRIRYYLIRHTGCVPAGDYIALLRSTRCS